MKKIGIFGGTFNPVHFGHIHLALALKESAGLDEVYFSPNFQSPFEEKSSFTLPAKHRLEMLNIALKEISGFFVTDYEILKKDLSFTIDLVKHVKNNFCLPEDELYLLLGDDLMAKFHLWKDVEELVSLARPLVGSRKVERKEEGLFNELKVEVPLMEISSSQIRERFKKGLYVGHLVPQKVLDYIYLNKLYL